MGQTVSYARRVLGVALLGLGTLFLVTNFTSVDISFGEWWPVILIALGALTLAKSRKMQFMGLLWVGLGTALLLDTLDVLPFSVLDLWPVLLLMLGASILFGRRGSGGRRPMRERAAKPADAFRPRAPAPPSAAAGASADAPAGAGADAATGAADHAGGWFDASYAFGGGERRVDSADFRGGKLELFCATATIDLSRAAMARPDAVAVIDVSIFLGSADIVVPHDWAVDLPTGVLLGSAEDKRGQPSTPTGRLVIKGSCMFGGITVKS